jgi:hypothetical protein
MDFAEAWDKILNYARAGKIISTLATKTNNVVIRMNDDEIVVMSDSPKDKENPSIRHLKREDFKKAFDLLVKNRVLTFSDLEHTKPSLNGRKSIIITFLAMGLDLKYDIKPIRIFMHPQTRKSSS